MNVVLHPARDPDACEGRSTRYRNTTDSGRQDELLAEDGEE